MTVTVELPAETRQWAIERGADAALAEGRVTVVVGIFGEHLKVCTAGCCLDLPGSVVVVPDVVVAELAANSDGASFGDPWRLHRADGREVYVYATPKGGGGRG